MGRRQRGGGGVKNHCIGVFIFTVSNNFCRVFYLKIMQYSILAPSLAFQLLLSVHTLQVMMYCTGGIRCERASALLGDVAAASGGNFKPAGVFELRGGIERYLKTYPEGGAWAGKNYVFDRRQVQVSGCFSVFVMLM